MYLYIFPKKLQESKEFLERELVVSSAIDEIRENHVFFGTFEVGRVERLKNPHHCSLRDISQINALQFTLFLN